MIATCDDVEEVILRGQGKQSTPTYSEYSHLDSNVGVDSPSIASLPCGVLAHIFENLQPRDLASVSCVCRAWRNQVALEAAANQLWRSLYSARWQLSGAQWPAPPARSAARPAPARPAPAPASASASASPSPGSSLACSPEQRWQWAYGSKMLRLRSWAGRYSADQVAGHKSAARAVRLLPSSNLLATASLDRTVRLWELGSGLPLGCSRPHGGTVRCLALAPGLLASGCSDALVRLWGPGSGCAAPCPLPSSSSAAATAAAARSALPLFDLASKPLLLRGHTGPVSCLALDDAPVAAAAAAPGGAWDGGFGVTLFSGSWDCTVRIWRRGEDADSDDACGLSGFDPPDGSGGSGSATGSSGDEGGSGAVRRGGVVRRAAAAGEGGGWSCAGVLQYGDWVYCCAVRGGNLLVAAGSEVVVTDAASGRAVRRFAGLHDGGAVAALEGDRSGRLLFSGGADGLLLAHDLRMKQGSRVLWHHNAALTGLAFEDPWLASAAADGCIMLQDIEQALAGGGAPPRALNASCRALHCPAGQPPLCIDLADQWLAAGTDSGIVRLWDFTGAAAAAERAAAAKAARRAAQAGRAALRQQQQQHRSQHQHQQQPQHRGQQPQQPVARHAQPGQQPHQSPYSSVPMAIPAGSPAQAGPLGSPAGSPPLPPPPLLLPRGPGADGWGWDGDVAGASGQRRGGRERGSEPGRRWWHGAKGQALRHQQQQQRDVGQSPRMATAPLAVPPPPTFRYVGTGQAPQQTAPASQPGAAARSGRGRQPH